MKTTMNNKIKEEKRISPPPLILPPCSRKVALHARAVAPHHRESAGIDPAQNAFSYFSY
jgi:hypothetical protein